MIACINCGRSRDDKVPVKERRNPRCAQCWRPLPDPLKRSNTMIVATKVREEVKTHGLITEALFLDGLEVEVKKIIKAAALRAKANGRKTIRSTDL